MKPCHPLRALFLAVALLLQGLPALAQVQPVLVVHGGAGSIRESRLPPEVQQQYADALAEAANAGYAVLERGGSSVDAVVAALVLLEDNPLFNAGKGAVLTNAGHAELDASLMDGSDHNAGAVAGVRTVKNPILAAKAVMDHSPHVMLARQGADRFAAEQGLDTVPPSYFLTERSVEGLKRARGAEGGDSHPDWKYGTVGAVALDSQGHLAAGTTTGGMTNKRWGRVGDSPIIAAGTYADDATCAVSCTGHGEFFIREVVAYDVAARMKYAGQSLREAATAVLNDAALEKGVSGGLIAVDSHGNVAMPFNTPGMFRAYRKADQVVVQMFDE